MKHEDDKKLAEALESTKFKDFFIDFSAIEGFVAVKSFSKGEDILENTGAQDTFALIRAKSRLRLAFRGYT